MSGGSTPTGVDVENELRRKSEFFVDRFWNNEEHVPFFHKQEIELEVHLPAVAFTNDPDDDTDPRQICFTADPDHCQDNWIIKADLISIKPGSSGGLALRYSLEITEPDDPGILVTQGKVTSREKNGVN